MKYLLSLLLTCSLYSAGFWTLSGLDKANIYVQNKVAYIKAATLDTIKTKMKQTLEKKSIKVYVQDAPTLMVSLEEIEGDETHYIYLKLELGEEVKTFRKDSTETFAITFQVSDFIETDADELDVAILESVDYLLAKFVEQLQEDKE
ncbi:hypothetical protein FJR48_11825 [Sulfurimonas lithotrophica]|uniref:Uncharacterized protein n=1 Tax=Sulfurimonas lithotrophica TaxID=2590022 RepID=A0A5P8P444_9BACT|nr:hypothetical protein [Sulfurimonas lithotrophica]QFR50377.1 hypothetical protein FJR48_11825 [Sulfurimonas lithotrophica]